MTDAVSAPVVHAAAHDRPDLEDELRIERARFYHRGKWSGPIGLLAATGLYTALIFQTTTAPSVIWVWAAAQVATSLGHIASFLIPSASLTLDKQGLPLYLKAAHVTFGGLWGATLWLDLSLTQDADFRWITLAALFAISGSASAGLAGINSLAAWMIAPMWLLAAAALFVVGQPVAGVAVVTALLLSLAKMIESRELWTELISLRSSAHREAHLNSRAARHDSLTGLLNRAGLLDILTSADPGSAASAVLLFIDLDRFKEVNDQLGHQAGDQVLAEVGRRLSASVRSSDSVARLGGDEFCVAFHDERTVTDALSWANRIITAVERPITIDTGEVASISASVGVAEFDQTNLDGDVNSLLADADHAMYLAKRRGRGQVVHFDDALRNTVAEQRELTAELRVLVAEHAVHTVAQPSFDATSGEVRFVTLEAVWPERCEVAPQEDGHDVMAIARQAGLGADLTNEMLTVVAQLQQLWASTSVLSNVRFLINVSPIEVDAGQLLDSITRLAGSHQLNAEQLTIELSAPFPQPTERRVAASFGPLRQLGVSFATDASTTMHSSLHQLSQLPIETIKIDRSLICDAVEDERCEALLHAVLKVAAAIGNDVIASGVESAPHVAELTELGVQSVSGSVFGEAMHARDLLDRSASMPPTRPVVDT